MRRVQGSLCLVCGQKDSTRSTTLELHTITKSLNQNLSGLVAADVVALSKLGESHPLTIRGASLKKICDIVNHVVVGAVAHAIILDEIPFRVNTFEEEIFLIDAVDFPTGF